MTGIEIAAFAGIILLARFLYIGVSHFKNIASYEDFFLATKTLENRENSASYFARFTSLATVLAFFLLFSKLHGIFLIISPITVLIGVWFFNYWIKRHHKLMPDHFSKYSSMTGLVNGYFDSKYLGIVTSGISLFTIFSILLIEIFIGVEIFSLYIKDSYYIKYTDIPLPITVGLLCLIVLAYSATGGLTGVVKTDKIQKKLIIGFVVVLFLYIFIKTDIFTLKYIHQVAYEEASFLPFPLLLTILVVNGFLFPSLYSTWQMRFASSRTENFIKGNINGAVSVFFIWTFLIFCGIAFPSILESDIYSIRQILEGLAKSSDIFLSVVVLPIFFVAGLSALMSTADSAIIPIIQGVYDSRFKKEEFSQLKPIIIAFVFFVITLALYIVVFDILEFDLISFLFAVFAFSLSISSLILWIVIFPKDAKRKARTPFFLASIVLGFSVAVGMAVVGQITGQNNIILYASPVAFCLPLVIQLLSIMYIGKPKND